MVKKTEPYYKQGSDDPIDFDYDYIKNWCDCTNQKISEDLKNDSGIPREFLKKTFTNFETTGLDPVVTQMKHTASNYYQSFKDIENTQNNSIALLGQSGSGKTHLMMALATNMFQNKRKSIEYFPYVEGFDGLKSLFNQKGSSDLVERKLEAMRKKDILFIDDLFKPVSRSLGNGHREKAPQASEWELKQMYSVINYRHQHYKPIFITSELSFEEMLDLDEALGSRILEMCKDYFVQIDNDRRLNYRIQY